jgi:hypothetical protein
VTRTDLPGAKHAYIRLRDNSEKNSEEYQIERMILGDSATYRCQQTPDPRTIVPGGPIGILCNTSAVSGIPIGPEKGGNDFETFAAKI